MFNDMDSGVLGSEVVLVTVGGKITEAGRDSRRGQACFLWGLEMLNMEIIG